MLRQLELLKSLFYGLETQVVLPIAARQRGDAVVHLRELQIHRVDRNCNSINSTVLNHSWFGRYDFKIKRLFLFSIGHYVVDQRSGDGRFIGRIKILAIGCWKEFSKL